MKNKLQILHNVIVILTFILFASGFVTYFIGAKIAEDPASNVALLLAEYHGLIAKYAIYLSVFGAMLLVALAVLKGHLSNSDNRADAGSRHTIWEALPFGALVFFLVSLFLHLDIMESAQNLELEKIYIRLGMSLTAALVTAIVVLYGTHLMYFEQKISMLVTKADAAKDEMKKSHDILVGATGNLEGLGTHLGWAVVALLARGRVAWDRYDNPKDSRRGDKDLLTEYGIGDDKYLTSMATYAFTADSEVIRHRGLKLARRQRRVARNMLANYLDEEAFDLRQNRLVTNARNYTGFLLGVARAFEKELKPNQRVLYLTHTLVAPTFLLNWPREEIDVGGYPSLGCHVMPFMLEYMTYCRHFSASKDKYIHGRVISTVGNTDRVKEYVKHPFVTPEFAVAQPEQSGLGTTCHPWGVPIWMRMKHRQENRPFSMFSHGGGRERAKIGLNLISEATDSDLNDLCVYYPKAQHSEVPIGAAEDGNPVLAWPIFFSDSPNLDYCMPNLNAYYRTYIQFRDHVKDSRAFWHHLRLDPISKKMIETVWDRFIARVDYAFVITRKNGADPDVFFEASEILFAALEDMRTVQWVFGAGHFMLWERFRAVLLCLANFFMGYDRRDPGDLKPIRFSSWFMDNFHTNAKLAWHYDRNALDVDQLGQSARKLAEREFALIGIIELGDDYLDTASVDGEMIQGCLDALVQRRDSSYKGCQIQELVGLYSRINHPWDFADVRWLWWNSNDYGGSDESEDFDEMRQFELMIRVFSSAVQLATEQDRR